MKVKIQRPESLKDIKLSQHQEFQEAVKDSEDIEFINNKMVSIFCNIDMKYIRQIAKKDYDKLVSSLTNILIAKPSITTKFTHNGIKYGLIPSMEDMTVGEQADLDSMYNDYSKRQKVMSILYRPITVQNSRGYLIEEYTGKEKPLDVNMEIVKGADVFFYNILKDCMIITQNYINQPQLKQKLDQALAKNGGGTATFTPSLMEIFLDLRMQLNLN